MNATTASVRLMRDPRNWLPIRPPQSGAVQILAIGLMAGVLLVLLQALIDTSWMNIRCSMIAAVSMAVTFAYCLQARVIRRAPLSTLTMLGFNLSTQSLALVAQTFSAKSLVFNLDSPDQTFGYSGLFQIVLIGAHAFYMNVTGVRRIGDTIARSALRPLGFFRLQSASELWFIGLFGLAATIYSHVSAASDIDYGDAGGKFLQSFTFFVLYPYLIPFRGMFLARRVQSNPLSATMLIPYTLVVVLLAMAINKRVLFATVGFTLIVSVLMMIWMGRMVLKSRTKLTLLVVALFAIPLIGIGGDISTAIVIARADKANGGGALISRTISLLGDRAALDNARDDEGKLSGGTWHGYSETYISSDFIQRLSFTKYTDLTMSDSRRFTNSQIERLKEDFPIRTISLLPTPLIQALHFDIDKGAREFSTGDLYEYLASGRQLGSFLTGSSVTNMKDLAGGSWPIALAVLALLVFIATDSFSLVAAGRVQISPAAFVMLLTIFDQTLISDSVANSLGTITRTYLTNAFCFLIVAWLARVTVGGLSRPRAVARLTPRAAGVRSAPAFGEAVDQPGQ